MPQLSRDFNERKALVRGLINALIRNESIETTEAKAKAIRGIVDHLITLAKKDSQSSYRQVTSFLEDETNSEKIIKEIAPSLKARRSGYTRITNIGKRKGDNAMIVRIEFSDKIERIHPKPKKGTSEEVSSLHKQTPAKKTRAVKNSLVKPDKQKGNKAKTKSR